MPEALRQPRCLLPKPSIPPDLSRAHVLLSFSLSQEQNETERVGPSSSGSNAVIRPWVHRSIRPRDRPMGDAAFERALRSSASGYWGQLPDQILPLVFELKNRGRGAFPLCAELFAGFCPGASQSNPDVVVEDMLEQSFSRIRLPPPRSVLSLNSPHAVQFSRSPKPLLQRHFESV